MVCINHSLSPSACLDYKGACCCSGYVAVKRFGGRLSPAPPLLFFYLELLMEPRLSLNSKLTVGDFTGHVVGISLKNGVELRKESEEEIKTFSFAEIENAVFYDKKISGFASGE